MVRATLITRSCARAEKFISVMAILSNSCASFETGQYATNLASGVWGTLAPSNLPGTGAQMQITDTNQPSMRFYRLNVQLAP